MKEITQVHIARVPFNIERDAHKELQSYLDDIGAVTTKAHRDDLVDEVESRIVEILDSRGVKRSGTITAKEVQAIREQLGEPKDFATDDTAEDPGTEPAETPAADNQGAHGFFKRRLFRDEKRGVILGVCYGLAKVIDIDPIWVRLAFVLLLFADGWGALVYIVLAILMPNVKTDADRLKMEGKPVNIQSLQWFKGEQARTTASHIRSVWEQLRSFAWRLLGIVLRAMVIVVGMGLIIASLVAFSVVASMLGGADKDWFGLPLVSGHWYVATAIVAALVGLVAFVLLIAVAIKQALVETGLRVNGDGQLSRRIAAASGAVLGLSLLTVLITAYPTARELAKAVDKSNEISSRALPPHAKTIDIQTHVGVMIRQDAANPRIEIQQPLSERARRVPSVTEQNGVVTVRDIATNCRYMCFDTAGTVTIYMATQPDVTIKDSPSVDIYGTMDKVTVDNRNDVLAGMNFHGSIRELRVTVQPGQKFDFAMATIGKLNVTYLDDGVSSSVSTAKVDEVTVSSKSSKKVCYVRRDVTSSPQDAINYSLVIGSFTKVVLNGTDATAQAMSPVKATAPQNDLQGCFMMTNYQ